MASLFQYRRRNIVDITDLIKEIKKREVWNKDELLEMIDELFGMETNT